MNLQRTILNMRNASRSNSIRNEQDPAKVAAQLESILFETINMQNTGSREFQIRALKELKQLRSDMTTGQINAGSKGHQYVGLYSHVIDQIENLTRDNERTNGALVNGIGSIKSSMPSTDSLVAALMTANPIVGYGAKIMRDIARSRKEAKARNAAESKKRLTMLKEQEKYLKSQLEAQEETTTDSPEQTQDELERGIYLSLLEEIRDEMKLLESYWRGDGDRLSESTEVIDNQLETLDDHLVEQIDSAEDMEAARIRNERLSRLDPEISGDLPIVDQVDTSAQRENKGGLLEGILGAPLRLLKGLALGFVGVITGIAGIFGIRAAVGGASFLAKLLSPIKALVGFVFNVGKFALSLGSKILLPAAVLLSLFDFFDGFFNADEILNKNDSDITLADRVLVGISNVIARFGELLDTVLEMFDIDLFDSTDLTKTIYDFFVSIPDRIGSMLESIMGSITTAIDDSITKVKSIVNSIIETFNKVYSAIEQKITDWGASLKSLPGIGGFFEVEKEEIKVDAATAEKAGQELAQMTSSMNLMRIGDGTATIVPLASSSQSNAQTIQSAERTATGPAPSVNHTSVNAPTNVNNNSKTIQAGNGTRNPNSIHRRMNEMNYSMR